LRGNINIDPLFLDPSNRNYQLQSSSPFINASSPSTEYNDAGGRRNDMGAYGGPDGDWEETKRSLG